MLKIGQLFFYTLVIGDTHNYSEQVIIYIHILFFISLKHNSLSFFRERYSNVIVNPLFKLFQISYLASGKPALGTTSIHYLFSQHRIVYTM